MRGHLAGFGVSFRPAVHLMLIPPSWAVLRCQMEACLRRLRLHRRHERLDAHDVHDPRQIVGEHVQGHLGGNPWQGLH